MLKIVRIFLWRILGKKYYEYLKYKNNTNLKDASWVSRGAGTYDNGAYVWRWNTNSIITIGNYCSIANDVHLIADSGYHSESAITTFPIFHEILGTSDSLIINGKSILVKNITSELAPLKQNITIGHDVWIGANVTILPGVKIGNGVTILTGAVVGESIADYAVVGGVPAKVIKYKHNKDVILKLNSIAWWNWSKDQITQKVNDFYLPIDEFINKYNNN